ncbi:MAG: tRNA (guanosine(37)-N1)-methyltransferase TrmD [Sediminibacterium sp.]|nr:tRNA (guanosine(37)-N1)-methyltransferase TrmD [Sediminibacterium sp.]
MLEIDILAVIPEIISNSLQYSILKRAQQQQHVSINIHQLRDWAINDYGQIDDAQYGGGAGMVLRCEPVYNAITDLQKNGNFDEIILTSPQGKTFNQKTANFLSIKNKILIICGHYKGFDERIKNFFKMTEISIGDYVLTGGEIPALVIIDSIVRLVPGVLNNETSALEDSFQDNLLSPPIYTRPAKFMGHDVPSILLQGDPYKIQEWRFEQSLEKTKNLRPDLLTDEGLI